MTGTPNADYAIAYKCLALCSGLSAAARRVAGVLLAHHNAKTGRCDPSVDRLVALLHPMHRATVLRATQELSEPDEATGRPALFKKSSHGGTAHCANYTPIWTAFRAVVEDFEGRMRRQNKHTTQPEIATANVAEKQPLTTQENDLQGHRNATQTHKKNSPNELGGAGKTAAREAAYGTERRSARAHAKGKEPSSSRYAPKPSAQGWLIHAISSGKAAASPSFAIVARSKAEDRIDRHFRDLGQDAYLGYVASIDAELHEAAVAAEVRQPGSGFRLIKEALRARATGHEPNLVPKNRDDSRRGVTWDDLPSLRTADGAR